MEQNSPVSIFWKMYIYGLHGYSIEVMFTAVFDFVFHGNIKLQGHSSIWIMPITILSGLVCEKINLWCRKRSLPLLARGFVYMIWSYIWEFTTGIVLLQFDMCPWDYSHYYGNFMGIITLEYAIFWFILGIILDQYIIKYINCLYWGPTHVDFRVDRKLE